MSINLEELISQVEQVEKAAIQKEKGGYKGDPRLLTFKKHCTYTLRLIPNVKDIDKTFVTYKEIGFKSRVDGSYIYGGRSPQDVGQKGDIFKTTQWDHYSKAKEKGDEVEQKASYKLLPQRKQLVNAYLVNVEGDDAESKEKIGQVVVVRYPAQVDREGNPISDIYKRIQGGIFGEMSKKIGTKALDITAKGKSLIIKVTEKAGFNNYSDTIFDDAEDVGLNDEVYSKIHDLSEFIPEVKTSDEAKAIIDKHWFGTDAALDDDLDEDETPPPASKTTKKAKDDDNLPFGDSKKTAEPDELDDLLAD